MKISIFVKILAAIIVSVIFLANPIDTNDKEFKKFRIVLDPGHGGYGLLPKSSHGDKYDLLSKDYLIVYAEGAYYKQYAEHLLMYQISKKVHDLLLLTQTSEGFTEFKKIALKFSNEPIRRVIIDSKLVRGESLNPAKINPDEDVNSEYRLYDYPDKNGNISPGRISKINNFKPHMVLSLHCDYNAPLEHRGITAIVVPPFDFLKKSLWFMEDRSRSIDFYRKSPYNSWFMENEKRSSFQWFIDDAMTYFTGFGLNRDYSLNENDYKGISRNMVTWSYSDPKAWNEFYDDEFKNIKNIENIKLNKKFWQREASIYEKYRRGEGPEGYGGDNLYACHEIIRYILTSLKVSGNDHKDQYIGNPYFSTWSIPIYVNAISVFLELGYLKSKRYQKLLSKNQDEIAEGIAVGIYSLFMGMNSNQDSYKYSPKGKKIDLEKYRIINNISYFDVVSD